MAYKHTMSRWQFPFKTSAEAKKYVAQAEQKTGRKCFVKKISYSVDIFKVFSSKEDWKKYEKKKQTQFKRS